MALGPSLILTSGDLMYKGRASIPLSHPSINDIGLRIDLIKTDVLKSDYRFLLAQSMYKLGQTTQLDLYIPATLLLLAGFTSIDFWFDL